MPTPPLSDETIIGTIRAWQTNNENIERTAKTLGLSRHAIQNRIRLARQRGLIEKPEVPPPTKKPSRSCKRTLDSFRQQYDDSLIIPAKIEEGIEKFLKDGSEPAWMRDFEFREACGVPVAKWRRYADDYKGLQVKVGSEIIWGHPDIVDEMRRAVAR
jgi:hypothetical protein